MVGHIPLEDGIGVRVPVPQLAAKKLYFDRAFSLRAGERK